MSDRLSSINRWIRRCGFRLQHTPHNPILADALTAIELARFHPIGSPATELAIAQLGLFLAVQRLLHSLDIELVIDVGANEGQFAERIRRCGYSGHIISIEPGSAAFATLSEVAPAGKHQTNLRCLAGSTSAHVPFGISKGSVFSSLHPPSQHGSHLFGDWMKSETTETVPMKTIDAILQEQSLAPKRILLKTDTQGHDLEVLRGAHTTLKTTTAVLVEHAFELIYEGAPRGEDIAAFLIAQGFKVAGLYPVTLVPGSQALLEADALYVRD